MKKNALNEEIPVHEWQQKVKHVRKGLKFSVRRYRLFYMLEKAKGTTLSSFRNFSLSSA